MDTPLDNPDMEILIDGKSFVQDGTHKAGYAAVLRAEQVLEANLYPPHPPARISKRQRAEDKYLH